MQYGYSPVGEPLIVRNDSTENVSYGITVTTSINNGIAVSAMRTNSNTANDFLNYVVGLIASGFLTNGDIFICDNASIHRAAHITAQLDAALTPAVVRMVFLPTYSPELNPCELIFAKTKSYLRYHRGDGRFADEIIDAFDTITEMDVVRFYVECIDGVIRNGGDD